MRSFYYLEKVNAGALRYVPFALDKDTELFKYYFNIMWGITWKI
jgi:hypothetical protein